MSALSARKVRPDVESLEDRLTPANAVVAGAISFPYPTLNNVSVNWLVSGDDNNNAAVSVQFRKQGDATWQTGMDLVRVPAGTNNAVGGVSWANQFSGSIFDLQPGTTYEVKLALTDPDGGSATPAIQTVTTRAVPTLAGLRAVNVTPATFAAALNNAQPGDVIDLAAGTYSGPFTATRNGTAANNIIIRSSSGGAIIQGNGTNAFDLSGRQYIHLDGLQINNGRIKINDSVGMAITNCIIRTPVGGIVGYASASRPESAYLADNQLFGSGTWQNSQVGANGNDNGDGIEITGPGHVIVNNYIHGFRDNISLGEGAGQAVDQHDIDIMNNDLDLATDDGIEADWSMGNVRILRNRITNAFDGISAQPSLGGPTYMVRNVMYNVLYTPFKLHNGSVGNVILNNSVVKNGDALGIFTGDVFARNVFRNNLYIGGPGGTYGGYSNDSGRIISLQASDSTNTFSNEAFGYTPGTFTGRIGSATFTSVAGLNALANVDNAIQIDLSVFAASVAFPTDPLATTLAPADLRLAAGSQAENAGLVIANVTNGYTGSAPDIGAYEVGVAPPVYGPRSAVSNAAPTVASAASATPSPVTGATTQLRVLGADDAGEAGLTYTWTVTSKPGGAANPTFAVNGTNAAKNTTATFSKAGSYTFQVTIRDGGGLTVASNGNVVVNQTLTSLAVSPATTTVNAGATRQFTAQGFDQFGNALAAAPAVTWTATGGTISSAGLFTAPATAGNVIVKATSGAVSATATVTVTAAAPPKIRLEAEALTLGGSYVLEADGSFGTAGSASGGKYIRVNGDPPKSGTAAATFSGPAGAYQVVVAYYDESDGASTVSVSLNGSTVDTWVFNQATSSTVPDASTLRTRAIGTLNLKSGDRLVLTGTSNEGEYARVDYLEFTPKAAPIRVEAESMALSGSYLVELDGSAGTAGSASGGKYARVKGSGQSGTATAAFNSAAGSYQVAVGYYDESDGAGTLTVKRNGQQLDSWALNQNATGSGSPDASSYRRRTLGTFNLQPGDLFTITGLSNQTEYARFDYLEFVPVT